MDIQDLWAKTIGISVHAAYGSVTLLCPRLTPSPRTPRKVPSVSTKRAALRQNPATRHFRNRLASPSQLFSGQIPNRCIYFFNCERILTARDIALKFNACERHQDDDDPYRVKALYAEGPQV